MAGVESLGEGGTIGKINTGSVANYAKVGPAGTPRVPIAFRVGEAGRISRNKLIKTIAMKARRLASFGWKVTSHRIKVACNRVRKLAGESASLIKKKRTRTCLDEMVNRIIDETGVTGFILESNTILTSMERE